MNRAVPSGRRNRALAGIAVVSLVGSIGAFVTDTIVHPQLLDWFDLRVYNQGGLLARHDPSHLYSWQPPLGVKFTYTPLAALLFAGWSELPFGVLRCLWTGTSLGALVFTIWLTFGALGWNGRRRVAATLVLAAVSLWMEPTLRTLKLGQVELILMALIVWDLSQSDRRRWKGAAIGLAAAIKLVPLIFIPYLVLCGKVRQALVATGVFIAGAATGFALLPQASAHWWLSGYFTHTKNVSLVGSLVNQSLRGLLTRVTGNVTVGMWAWLIVGALMARSSASEARCCYTGPGTP